MKTIIEKMETVKAEFNNVSKEVDALLERKETALKDPCLDFDDEMHEAFDSIEGVPELKELDEPAYNESFNNWVDSILKDDCLQNVLPDYAEIVEALDNWELYKDDLEEALDAMSDALTTITLMIS